MRKCLYCLVLLILTVPLLRAVPGHKVETIGACGIPEVSEEMRNSLQKEGVRILDDTGVLCEIWLRKQITQKPGSTGNDYGTLAPGTFVGLISYPTSGGDYRGQAVRPGTYTLRYQTMPMDGNHLGVAPGPNFLLLSPASADKNPDAVIDYQELIRLSKQASGTNHPNPLFLTSPTSAATAVFREVDDSHWALEVKTKARPEGGTAEVDYYLALILIGKAEG